MIVTSPKFCWRACQLFERVGMTEECETSEKGQQPATSAVSMAEEYRDWGTKTSFGILGGMMYGGLKEALASTHYGEVLAPMQEGKDLRTKRFMWRELLEQRLIRISRGTVIGGAKLGTFTAIFCGVQSWLAVERNVHDTLNVVAAGSATAASFGLALPGSFVTRTRAGAIGSIMGSLICLPLGYVQTRLQQRVAEANDMDNAVVEVKDSDGIAKVIRHLEENLSESEAYETKNRT